MSFSGNNEHNDTNDKSSKAAINPKVAVNLSTTTNTASSQHQQEQELLANFAIPNPPMVNQGNNLPSDAVNSPNDSNDETPPVENPDFGTPRTLWMGDLDPWLDESGIQNLWWQLLGKEVSVKLIRPRGSKPEMNYNMYGGLSHSGYCFIEFESFDDAKQALSLNGKLLPDLAIPSQTQFPNNPDNQKKYFRLNWASGATLSAPIVQSPEYSLFVGDLSASTTEAHLLAFFQKLFPDSVKTVRVMTDPVNGKSRCFGFVRFTEESERQRALKEMNGVWFGGRALRVALATPRFNKKSFDRSNQQNPTLSHPGHRQEIMYMPPPFGFYGGLSPNGQPVVPQPPMDSSDSPTESTRPDNLISNDIQDKGAIETTPMTNIISGYNSPIINAPPSQLYNDPNNTTVFVGGLSSDVGEQTLFTLFSPFGVIRQIKIPPGKNCGFVKYSMREEAEEAIASMQGYIIGGNRVRLSWGRVNANNKKFHHQPHHVAQAAQAAQMQAAAALSMGYDPTSAIAAAAAVAAAQGYNPGQPPMSAMPPTMPPGAMGPGAMGPGSMGPGPLPPGVLPPGTLPPGAIPHNMPHVPPGGYQMGDEEYLTSAMEAVHLDENERQ